MAYNDKLIWDYLMSKTNNAHGTAALMGNLFVESKLDPGYIEASAVKKIGMTKAGYLKKLNDCSMSCSDFANDGVGFGIVQWTYKTRKADLYSYIKERGYGQFADLSVQLEFMWNEISTSYKTVYNAIMKAKDIRTCSDVICKKYEKPAAQDETHLQFRANYGECYYELYALGNPVITATSNVNLRLGNGKEFEKVGRLEKDHSLPYIATSSNGWFAVKTDKQVLWLDSQFAELRR